MHSGWADDDEDWQSHNDQPFYPPYILSESTLQVTEQGPHNVRKRAQDDESTRPPSKYSRGNNNRFAARADPCLLTHSHSLPA